MKIVTVMSSLFLFLLLAVIASGQESTFTKQVVDSVRSVCQAPGEQGKYWEVEATGKGDVNLRVLKTLPGVGVEGKVRFSKGEWEGVQRVLREHQARDNADYRDCAKTLTPLFLKHVPQK